MTPAPTCSASRCRRIVTLALAAALAAPCARAADEPGPVPLVRDAAPAQAAGDPRPPVAPAGLGDWRLVAALGVACAVLIGARMVTSRRAPPPPPDVFEVLGTASLGGQHAVRIVRFGPKTLLVGVSAAGAATLAEIADPQATASIAAACRNGWQPPRPAARGPEPVPHARLSAAQEVT